MKKRVRDKRGFTLIELLVVIALMLSILGIAVVSFVGISNKKKESSKELIKEQIETAALEYFNANEFLFSNLKDESTIRGVISVGKLVNDDYLNVVTNPVTGKRIGNCTVVVVKRKNNVFTSDVDDESFENATDNQTGTQLTNVCDSILVSSDDIQGGKITYYDENYKKLTGKRFKDLSDNKKLWFNSKHLGENKNLIACLEDEVEVTNTKGEKIKVEKNSHGYCATIKNGTNEDIKYSSKDWALTVAERVDTTPPLVSNLKVESENSYIGSERFDDSKEYMSKFYSFKLIPKMPGKKSILTYSDAVANSIRKSVTSSGYRRTNDFYNMNNSWYRVKNSRDSEDIIVDGKLMMLRNQHGDVFEDISPEIVDKMLPDLKDNGIYLISHNLEEKDFPKDITDYYWNSSIDYDLNHKDNYQDLYFSDGVWRRIYKKGETVKDEHIVDNEIRKVYKDYLYYTKQKILCKINVDVDGRTFQEEHFVCSKIIEAYPETLNVNTAGIFSTLYHTIPRYSSNYNKVSLSSAPAYANYGKEINGQLTKVSFAYKDDTSKVYSYGLDKKNVKRVKRNDKFGDLIETNYLTKTLQKINNIEDISYNRNLYSYSYTTDKNKSLKGEGLNEEYNKEVLNSVEIYDLKQSEDNYEKEKVNKKEGSVEINHIYSFEDNSESKLDGSVSNYKLTIKDNAGNEMTSKASYEKYKLCTYTKQKVWDTPVDEQSCEDVCNSHGTLVTKRGLGMVAWVDEATEEFCSEPEFFGEDEVRTPNSPECPWTDCTVTTAKKTTKNQTTKSSKTTSTTKACDWSKVKISFSVSNANKDHCYAVDESVTKEKDATSFTVDFDYPSDFKKIATHAAFCKDAKTCKNITTSNKNQTSVVCTNSTNCYEEYKYVGASIELECGNTTKTIFDYDSIK